jgi:PEP-CTERM motif-containing protein
MSIKRVVLLVALAFALAPLSTLADTLDFIIDPINANALGGTISYSGGLNPLMGSQIVVDRVTDITTGVSYDFGDGPQTTPGVLSFTTGANTGGWSWGGGSFSITASCIDSDKDDADFCDPVLDDTLASGVLGLDTFVKGTITSASVIFSGGTFHVSLVEGTDLKDPNMLALFGIAPPTGGWSAQSGIFFDTLTVKNTGDAFTSSNIDNGKIRNAPAVPEPGSLLLLGTGLLSVGGFLRRRITAV